MRVLGGVDRGRLNSRGNYILLEEKADADRLVPFAMLANIPIAELSYML
jgi:hypothetical protein